MLKARISALWFAPLALAAGTTGWSQSVCEVAKLKGTLSEQAGYGLAMSGDTLVIGAAQNSAFAANAGLVYVYVRVNGVWTLQATLHAMLANGTNDAAAGDRFGIRVAFDGKTIVVGAPFKDSSPTDFDTGYSYVFERNENGTVGDHADDTWSFVRRLEASPASQLTGNSDFFGYDVFVRGDLIVVGAPATSKAYVYRQVAGSWPQFENQILTSNDPTTAEFGFGLALDDTTLFVGQRRWAKSGVGPDVGRIHVFQLQPNLTWLHVDTIEADSIDQQGYAFFGGDLDAEDGSLVAGAVSQSNATNPNGAVFVFERTGATWTSFAQVKKWQPDLNPHPAAFGVAVDLQGPRLLTAAYDEAGSGVAYVYDKVNGVWNENYTHRIVPAGGSDDFGIRTVLFGDEAFIGARQDKDNQAATFAGAVFIYDLNSGSAVSYGQACPGSGGFAPTLSVNGCPSVAPGNAMSIRIANGLGGGVATLLIALTPSALPLPGTNGCTLSVNPILGTIRPLPLSGIGPGNGSFELPLLPTSAFPVGLGIQLQAVLTDPTVSSFNKYTTTNGLTLTFY